MPIEIFSIGPLETNCYVVYNEGSALVVDPGGEPSPILAFLQEKKLNLEAVLLTHLHFDHMYGVADLHAATKAPVFMPGDDSFMLETQYSRGGMWGFPDVKPFEAENLSEGQHTFGALQMQVIHTSGHSPGSMSFYFPALNLVCTGDTLFYRSVGRSDLPGGNFDTLVQSIKTKLFALPSETMVYPGHGPETSIGDEMTNNPYCGSFVR